MSLLDDLQSKADVNGDGKVTKEDLESLQNGEHKEQIEQLKNIADQNGDGKVDLNDLKNFDFGDAISGLKDKLF